MRAVTVRRLNLRVPYGHLAESRQRVEDALWLAAPDETRLVILRRLDLGRLPANANGAAWTDRAQRSIADRRARAVHGAQPGAEHADAVWFRSADEARTLLLLLLASGRHPAAWFWRLAVPDWRDRQFRQWLADWAAVARCEPAAEVALARAVIEAVRAGFSAAIMPALDECAARVRDAPLATPQPAGMARVHDPQADVGQAASLLARHDAVVRREIARTLAGRSVGRAAAAQLARLALVAAAPELAGHADYLMALADALVARLRDSGAAPFVASHWLAEPAQAPAPDPPAASTRQRTVPPEAMQPAQGTEPPPAARQPVPSRAGHTLAADQAEPDKAGSPAAPMPDGELHSHGAGVLLAIRALDRLGLGAWLAGDADAAAAGFGRHLLRHIALCARLPPEDCLFGVLDCPATAPDTAALHAWRAGLDRWLRRRVRVRLSDLARRRGWLLRAETSLTVRFPVQSADLRLRRMALDVDPGWVAWLGLSVRYHFSETPLA